MKVDELSGAALDWEVALIEYPEWKEQGYLEEFPSDLSFDDGTTYSPSTNWAQGGPIIEREGIELHYWSAHSVPWSAWIDEEHHQYGTTPLIAAMRCYVASKQGEQS